MERLYPPAEKKERPSFGKNEGHSKPAKHICHPYKAWNCRFKTKSIHSIFVTFTVNEPGDMKKKGGFMFGNRFEEMSIHVGKNGMVSLGRGDYEIRCIRGSLWATWPGSGDRILGAGDGLSVRQHGKICITSKTGALMCVKKRKILPSVKDMPGLAVAKLSEQWFRLCKGRGPDGCHLVAEQVEIYVQGGIFRPLAD